MAHWSGGLGVHAGGSSSTQKHPGEEGCQAAEKACFSKKAPLSGWEDHSKPIKPGAVAPTCDPNSENKRQIDLQAPISSQSNKPTKWGPGQWQTLSQKHKVDGTWGKSLTFYTHTHEHAHTCTHTSPIKLWIRQHIIHSQGFNPYKLIAS